MPIVGKLIKKAIEFRKKTAVSKKNRVDQQYKTLKKNIKKAKETAFGRQYHFEALLQQDHLIKEFQRSLPVFTYEEMYKNWWHLFTANEENICWPGRIQYFALSSGTSDASTKYIPVSAEMIKSIRKNSMRQIYTMANYDLPDEIFQKEVLMIGGSTHLDEINGLFYGDMSGISTAEAIPIWFVKGYFKPGERIAAMPKWTQRVEAIVQEAPLWDIGIICGIPSWVQMVLQKIIDYYQLQSIHDIWPNLKVYVHGGIFFEPYKESFKNLLAKEIVFAETYMASEGYFGFTTHAHSRGIKLILNNGIFYEFIPFNSFNFDANAIPYPHAVAYTIDEVKENIEYAVVITNNSGAWRYLIGDTIKFVNLEEAEIKLTGRTKHFLSVCDEHVSVDNIVQVIKHISQLFSISINEFSVISCKHQTTFFHKWYIGTQINLQHHELIIAIDLELQRLNDDYKIVREHLLGPPQVEIVPVQYFYDWLKFEKKEGNQFKIPRVMKGDAADSWQKFLITNLIDQLS